MKTINLVIYVSLLLFAYMLASCSDDEEKVKPAQLIGLSLVDTPNNYMEAVVTTIQKECIREGYTLLKTSSEGKIVTQQSQLESMKSLGVKSVILVAPEENLSGEIAALKQAGIPLINIVNLFEDSNLISASVINDHNQAGTVAGEAINNLLTAGGRYQVLFMTGENSEKERNDRLNGLNAALNEGITAFSSPLACVDSLSAVTRARTILSREVNVCVAMDDISLYGFVEAMKESPKSIDEVSIIGISGSPASKQLLKEGKITAIIAQSPINLALETAKVCFKLLNGETGTGTALIKNELITTSNISDYDIYNWE